MGAQWVLRKGHTILELNCKDMTGFWLFQSDFRSKLLPITNYEILMSQTPNISRNFRKMDNFWNSVHMHPLEAIHTVYSTAPPIKNANYLKSTQKYVVMTPLSNILDMCRFTSYRRFASECGGFLSRSGYSPASLNKNCKRMLFLAFIGAKSATNFAFRADF